MRTLPSREPRDGEFDEIVCQSEDTARALAQERQAAEPENGAEWIYLRNLKKEWVARRIPPGYFERPENQHPEKPGLLTIVFGELLDPNSWPKLLDPDSWLP
jgi:hypothetical protein